MDLQTYLDQAQKMVFLTGAGVSTASGIPDYRSKGGLYSGKERPEYLLSRTCLAKEPQKFYAFVKKMYYPKAQPNVIHQKMAQLAQKGRAKIITQNIDDLHRQAGTPEDCLVEFHGNLYEIFCQKCGQRHLSYQDYLASPIHIGCGGVLRPDIILYEEGIPTSRLQRAIVAIQRADLLVVCGTSLVVYPFADLLEYRQSRAQVVALNREALSLPRGAQQIIGDAREQFAQVQV